MSYQYDRQVGQNIRRLRRTKGWTQEQLAAKLQTNGCDLPRSAVAKIEIGQRHLYAYEIKLLREIFKVNYEQIIDGL